MESIITKNWLGHPMTTLNYTAQDQRCSGPSYGWRVCRPDYEHIEDELLDLIAQCQFEKPADRPQLSYLLRKIHERKHRGFQEEDDETRDFWDIFWARTRNNPTGVPNTPPVPLSQTSTIAASGSETQGSNNTAGQGQNEASGLRSRGNHNTFGQGPDTLLPSTQPFSQGTTATNSNSQLPPSPSRYAETGNPLIAHVAALRRRSQRVPLSVSSTESSISLHPRSSSSGRQTTGIDPTANLPPSGSATQKKRPSSDDESSSEASGQNKRARFSGSSAAASLAVAVSLRNLMDDSMDDSPGSLDRAWPVVPNTAVPSSRTRPDPLQIIPEHRASVTDVEEPDAMDEGW